MDTELSLAEEVPVWASFLAISIRVAEQWFRLPTNFENGVRGVRGWCVCPIQSVWLMEWNDPWPVLDPRANISPPRFW